MASQKEILKEFLSDEEFQKKYNLTEKDIATVDLATDQNALAVNLIKAAIRIIENKDLTENTAASNLNSTLENLLNI